ncbi:hypothetical protein, partial [Yersinia pestis]|uniref:hypothetical protein n=1 Tax=Yersinia pestis TaxID=632 RepID=UPI0035A87AD0
GVFITDPKLKALLNPQPSWGFSGHNQPSLPLRRLSFMFNKKILNSAIISSGHLMNMPKII